LLKGGVTMEYNELLKTKCTLKEYSFLALLIANDYADSLFLTSFGQVIGKPYKDPEGNYISSQISLTDVIIINNNGVKTNYTDFTFTLFIDQVIAMTPIDRDYFLSQLDDSGY